MVSTPRRPRRARPHESSTIADELLMLRYQRGDRAAFESLTHKYAPLLFNLLGPLAGPWHRPNQATARRLVKRTLLSAVVRAHGFRHDQHFSTWIYSIAAGVWMEDRAAVERATPANDAQDAPETDHDVPAQKPCEQAQAPGDSDWPLAVLTPNERLVFCLATLTDLPFEELADVASVATVDVPALVLQASRKIYDHSSLHTPPATRTGAAAVAR